VGKHGRPFICTARKLEGPDFVADALGLYPGLRYMWCQMDQATFETADVGRGSNKQRLGWFWQDGKNKDDGCFTINATNRDNGSGAAYPLPKHPDAPDKMNGWLYRAVPIDGTMAVIDEFKVCSGLRWDTHRIRREMEVSRYYLPGNPSNRNECPTFTSQSLLQSLRGVAAQSAGSSEYVAVARVGWTVFTPRFMLENKQQDCSRYEWVRNTTQTDVVPTAIPIRGPFDFVQYNHDLGIPEGQINQNALRPALSVDRPTLADYRAVGLTQTHASRGVEIELLNGTTPLEGQYRDPVSGAFVDAETNTATGTKSVFRNPDSMNRYGTPVDHVRVRTDRLHYRVRFRYPVDQLVKRAHDAAASVLPDEHVNPAKHYLLDTPVFDDISVTYFGKARILSHREMTE
jgi:hypothetical protein